MTSKKNCDGAIQSGIYSKDKENFKEIINFTY